MAASVGSVITGGLGPPGSTSLFLTGGFGAFQVNVTTPAARILTISAEDRVLKIELEDRVFAINAADRALKIEPEDRVWTIPIEDRTRVIK